MSEVSERKCGTRSADMSRLRAVIAGYCPKDAAETADRERMLAAVDAGEELLTRGNTARHFTASAWIVDPERKRVLFCWHKLYRSWSWTGGHADGDADLAFVALKEAREETGLKSLRPAAEGPVSVEILSVAAHIRRGEPVAAHEHWNLTYLFTADPDEPLTVCEEENAGLRWFPLEEAAAASNEEEMRPVYVKLIERTGRP